MNANETFSTTSNVAALTNGSGLGQDRMPPLSSEEMAEPQRKAAAELAAGPRGGVRRPFIPLLLSLERMDRLQRVGEYLRYDPSAVSTSWGAPSRAGFQVSTTGRFWVSTEGEQTRQSGGAL